MDFDEWWNFYSAHLEIYPENIDKIIARAAWRASRSAFEEELRKIWHSVIYEEKEKA
jgi:hypothetical protein